MAYLKFALQISHSNSLQNNYKLIQTTTQLCLL